MYTKLSTCDVLLIGPPASGTERIFGAVPVGIGSLCAILEKQNIACAAITGSVFHNNADQIKECIAQYTPRIIGFSHSEDKTGHYFRKIEFIKSCFPEAVLFFGGPFPSLAPRVIFRSFPEAVIMMGEAEITMPGAVTAILQDKPLDNLPGVLNAVTMHACRFEYAPLIEDLDTLPVPYRGGKDYLQQWHGPLPIETSRGCSFCCHFCSLAAAYKAGNPQGWSWRGKSPERIADEIEFYMKEFDIGDFIIIDGNFIGRPDGKQERLLKIRDFLHKNRTKGTYTIQARIDDLDEDTVKLLKEIGVRRIFCGVETVNREILGKLGKTLKKKNMLHSINLMESSGIEFSIGMMTFNPFATLSTIKEDMQFQKQFAHKVQEANVFTRLIPYHGLPVTQKLSEKNMLVESDPLSSNYNGYILNDKNVLYLYRILKILFLKIIRPLGEMITEREKVNAQQREYAIKLKKELSGCFVESVLLIIEWIQANPGNPCLMLINNMEEWAQKSEATGIRKTLLEFKEQFAGKPWLDNVELILIKVDTLKESTGCLYSEKKMMGKTT